MLICVLLFFQIRKRNYCKQWHFVDESLFVNVLMFTYKVVFGERSTEQNKTPVRDSVTIKY